MLAALPNTVLTHRDVAHNSVSQACSQRMTAMDMSTVESVQVRTRGALTNSFVL